jgi:hypothetical protein
MMRYVPVETDTEEKKMFWFHQGLNYEIRIILAGDDYSSFMSMVNRAMAVEKEVTFGAERLMAKRIRAYHQSHLNMFGQNSQVHQEDEYQQDQNRQHIGQTLEQYTGVIHTGESSASGKITLRCLSCRQRGHKRAECPGRKALGKKKPAKKVCKKNNQMSTQAPRTTGKSAQTPRTSDCGQLTHLTGRKPRDAPYAMTGEQLAEDSKL